MAEAHRLYLRVIPAILLIWDRVSTPRVPSRSGLDTFFALHLYSAWDERLCLGQRIKIELSLYRLSWWHAINILTCTERNRAMAKAPFCDNGTWKLAQTSWTSMAVSLSFRSHLHHDLNVGYIGDMGETLCSLSLRLQNPDRHSRVSCIYLTTFDFDFNYRQRNGARSLEDLAGYLTGVSCARDSSKDLFIARMYSKVLNQSLLHDEWTGSYLPRTPC